ncbi:MAG TPA: adenosylcobinamide-phosphate synthase CbiB [Desulfobaccales bacterium]|nr:adenosylcobinamide-phosphate synthase CbiB [Desulfobaccales bacterium]
MGLALPFLLAYLLDLLLGDPPGWPHPVRLLGSIVHYWESALYKDRVGAGALFWLAVMGTTLVLIVGVLGVAALMPPWGGIAVLAYFLYTGLATRSLHLESLKVEAALAKSDLDGARASLSLIVGRETAHLTPEDIRRAEIETVAENLADGVVAPMFFTLVLGLPGLFFYKAANTMDSMVGYKNYWYARFGKVAARADDILNFIPARLTALLMIPTAAALGLDWRGAWQTLRRDRRKASSPNAGWPEAAMAGALGVRLGGPSTYFGRRVDKPFIGEAGQPLDQERYGQAIRLLYGASLSMAAITVVGLLAGRAGVWGLLSLVR